MTKESTGRHQRNEDLHEIELLEINKHYEFVKQTLDSWPMWKQEIFQNLLKNSITTTLK